jgi:hypothetical protein
LSLCFSSSFDTLLRHLIQSKTVSPVFSYNRTNRQSNVLALHVPLIIRSLAYLSLNNHHLLLRNVSKCNLQPFSTSCSGSPPPLLLSLRFILKVNRSLERDGLVPRFYSGIAFRNLIRKVMLRTQLLLKSLQRFPSDRKWSVKAVYTLHF